MPKVRFNIRTNFRGTLYLAGDEIDLSDEDIKLFKGADSSGKAQITKVRSNAKKNAPRRKSAASDNSSD